MADRLNRTIVIQKASDLADEIGFENLTITRLANALGISAPGVYRHVVDSRDLGQAIGGQAAREMATVLAAACAGRSGRESLAALAQAFRAWAREHPGRYAALQVAPDIDDVEGGTAASELLDVISAALHAYQLSGDNLTDAIRFVRSTLHGFIMLEQGGGFKQLRSIEASFERIVDSLDGVLGMWRSAQ